MSTGFETTAQLLPWDGRCDAVRLKAVYFHMPLRLAQQKDRYFGGRSVAAQVIKAMGPRAYLSGDYYGRHGSFTPDEV